MELSPDVLSEILGYVSKYPKYKTVSKEFEKAYEQYGKFGNIDDFVNEYYSGWNKSLKHAMFHMNRAAIRENWDVVTYIYDNMLNPDKYKSFIDEENLYKKNKDGYVGLLTMYLLMIYNIFDKFEEGYKYFHEYQKELELIPELLGIKKHVIERDIISAMNPYFAKYLLDRYKGKHYYLYNSYDIYGKSKETDTPHPSSVKDGPPYVYTYVMDRQIGYADMVEFIYNDRALGDIRIPKGTHKPLLFHAIKQIDINKLISDAKKIPVSKIDNNPIIRKISALVHELYKQPVITPTFLNLANKILDIYINHVSKFGAYYVLSNKSNLLLQYVFKNKYILFSPVNGTDALSDEIMALVSPNAKKPNA